MTTKDQETYRAELDHRDEWAVSELERRIESRDDELASIRAQLDSRDAELAAIAAQREEAAGALLEKQRGEAARRAELCDHVAELERRLKSRDAELAAIRTQREEAAGALLAIIRPELDAMVHDLVRRDFVVLTLSARLDELEEGSGQSAAIREEVREMICDGEIVVSVDVM